VLGGLCGDWLVSCVTVCVRTGCVKICAKGWGLRDSLCEEDCVRTGSFEEEVV
jgi:hypothetical protein